MLVNLFITSSDAYKIGVTLLHWLHHQYDLTSSCRRDSVLLPQSIHNLSCDSSSLASYWQSPQCQVVCGTDSSS